MLHLHDLAAPAAVRADRCAPRRRIPVARRHQASRRLTVATLSLGLAVALGLLVGPQPAAAQGTRTCATVIAQVDALNARLVANSDRMERATRAMMAGQAAHRAAMEAERKSGVAAGVAGALLGSFVPGGGMVGALLRPRPPATRVDPASDESAAEITAALASAASQGADAMRAGALMAELEQLGCNAR